MELNFMVEESKSGKNSDLSNMTFGCDDGDRVKLLDDIKEMTQKMQHLQL